MAVIKIVPMPGAKGDQGDAGSVGPQGPQGETGATGSAGADAVWYYNGAYNPGAAYAVGDIVTYEGQTWYRKNANGGNVGDTPSEGLFWDLLAAKGENGVSGTVPLTGTWETNFFTKNGITKRNLSTDDIDQSLMTSLGNYTVVGDIVFWDFHTYCWPESITGQNGNINSSFAIDMPLQFPKKTMTNYYGSTAYNLTEFTASGRVIARADEIPYYEYSDTNGDGFNDTIVQDWEPDEFVSVSLFGQLTYNSSTDPDTFICTFFHYDDNDINSKSIQLRPFNANSLVNLTSEEAQDAPVTPTYLRVQISGWYRRETANNINGLAESFIYKSGAVPPTHHGSVGDFKNDVRYDGTHLYICVEDYTDGTAIIWRRINWASGNW